MASFSLHHNSLYVKDVNRAAAFYADVLGLEEIPNRVAKSHIRWFVVDAHRTIHLIGGDAETSRERPFSTHLALATADFDEILATLTRHGVPYVNVARQAGQVSTRGDGIRQIYFQDPDGHWIEINDATTAP